MAALTIDLRGIKEFQKNFTSKKAVGKFFGAIRQTINDQASGTRETSKKKTIPRAMTTRKGRFNQRSVFSTFAKGRGLIALTGARKAWRGNSGADYRGLEFIELGTTQKNPGIPSVVGARGGSKSTKVKKAARFPQLGNAVKLSPSRPRQTISQLAARRYKGSILIRKNQIGRGNFKAGFYKFAGKYGKRKTKRAGGRMGFDRLVLIKDLESDRSKTRVKNPWLLRATKKNTTPTTINKLFIKNVRERFKPRSG